jgi:hypothetical protein
VQEVRNSQGRLSPLAVREHPPIIGLRERLALLWLRVVERYVLRRPWTRRRSLLLDRALRRVEEGRR